MQPRYTETLINLMENEQTAPLLEEALSTYEIYVSKSQHEFGAPNIIPTRAELNKKLLNAYKYREIGFETVGRFLDELKIAMEEIMPKYNQLMYSADQDYNMTYNVDYKRTIDRDRDNTSDRQEESESTGNTSSNANDQTQTTANINNNNKHVHSETPQNDLNVPNTQIENVQYADDVSWNKDTNTEAGTSTGSSTTASETEAAGTTTAHGTEKETEATIETTKGNFGVVSAQDLILKYRQTIINIEQQIINDPRITELFMTVF